MEYLENGTVLEVEFIDQSDRLTGCYVYTDNNKDIDVLMNEQHPEIKIKQILNFFICEI